MKDLIIDHIGYAVKNVNKSISEFEKFGFVFEDIIDDIDRNIHICFGSNGSYRIELVSPMDKEKPSPVDTYLLKVGPIAYHFCYQSDNLEGDILELEKQGFRVIIEPAFAIAFSGGGGYKKVAFLKGKHFGIFEIVEI